MTSHLDFASQLLAVLLTRISSDAVLLMIQLPASVCCCYCSCCSCTHVLSFSAFLLTDARMGHAYMQRNLRICFSCLHTAGLFCEQNVVGSIAFFLICQPQEGFQFCDCSCKLVGCLAASSCMQCMPGMLMHDACFVYASKKGIELCPTRRVK